MYQTPDMRSARRRQQSLLHDMERLGWLLLAIISLLVGIQVGRVHERIDQATVSIHN